MIRTWSNLKTGQTDEPGNRREGKMDGRGDGEAADVDMGGGDATIHEAFESFVVEAEEMTRVMSSLENYSSRDNLHT